MEIELDLKKSLHENAGDYYDRAKKLKKKAAGAREALEASKRELEKAQETEKPTTLEKKRKRDWFEKYHWLKTTNGFLVVAGRDAKSNEAVVKRQMKKDDLFFHADIQGAAVTILIDGQKAKKQDREDAAKLAAVFSKAWGAGVGSINVYSVKPDQVKTAAKAGESLAKGSFVMEGKREWFKSVPLEIFAVFDGFPAVSATQGIRITPGKTKKSDLAKKLRAKFGGTLDDWMLVLPSGGDMK
ncbi:NFACT RNA binding domain-containing protein [archaeon]